MELQIMVIRIQLQEEEPKLLEGKEDIVIM